MQVTSSFLRNYRTDGAPAARLERVLAIGRTFLTVAGLIAIYLDPTEPTRFAAVTYVVLLAYAVYSVAVLAWAQSGVRIVPIHGCILHGVDILWASVLTFISEGPVSPFFLFFLFVVAAAAYRWGFRETVATVATTVTVFLIETAIATQGPWNHTWFGDIAVEVDRTIMRIAYLLLTAFLVGYLAEQEKQTRAELSAIAHLARQPRLDLGLRGSVMAVADGLRRTFDAATIVVVLREQGSPARLWRLDRGEQRLPPSANGAELDLQRQDVWLFADDARAWYAVTIPGSADAAARVSEPGVWQLRRGRLPIPATILDEVPARTVTAVNMGLASEWWGRIYLFDIATADSLVRVVHFLEAVTEHVAPAMTNVFLHRRLRSRESAAERARVARELHDGTIQSLIGIEMKLEALRRRHSLTSNDNEEIENAQHLLRGEVMALRELMQALRPIELDAHEKLPDVLASVVERFRRDSGISARFVTNGEGPPLRPAAALEIVRVVQEALVNVRKHSRANNVLVRLVQDRLQHHLIVEDDGRGFEFEGNLTAAELDERRTGPAIIKERARALGADLWVHSTLGVGARIELILTGNGKA